MKQKNSQWVGQKKVRKNEAPAQIKDKLPNVRKGEELPDYQSGTDVYGSYTGAPVYGEQPVQDADDL